MSRPLPRITLRLLACPLAVWLAMAPAVAASFTVIDSKAAEEISETTRLYVDGKLVASFRLDDQTPQISLPIKVPETSDTPAGRTHDYALCGEITIRGRGGAREIHEVSAHGRLLGPDGRVFSALGARDFTLFFLADPTDPSAVQIEAGHSSFCQTPVA